VEAPNACARVVPPPPRAGECGASVALLLLGSAAWGSWLLTCRRTLQNLKAAGWSGSCCSGAKACFAVPMFS